MTSPGLDYGNYYKLKEIIDKGTFQAKKVLFEVKGNLVNADGKPIQGLKILGTNVNIKGIHYTSWENATQIRSTRRFEPSINDPYVYFAPKGAMQGWSKNEICKELGAGSAEAEIIVECVVPVERVWLKASRRIIHFAVDKMVTDDEIVDLKIQRRKQSS